MLLTANDVADLLQVTRMTVYNLMSNQDFPKPIKLGSAVRWESAEVDTWLEAQKAKRGAIETNA
jgi:excisionase family DNA binding protein